MTVCEIDGSVASCTADWQHGCKETTDVVVACVCGSMKRRLLETWPISAFRERQLSSVHVKSCDCLMNLCLPANGVDHIVSFIYSVAREGQHNQEARCVARTVCAVAKTLCRHVLTEQAHQWNVEVTAKGTVSAADFAFECFVMLRCHVSVC